MSDDERWIVITRWSDFQHADVTRSVVPPWIKNYTRLMSDDNYLSLTGHRRAILHGLWLEYARSRSRLRDDTRMISHRLALKVTTSDLKALNHAGFIEFLQAPHMQAVRARRQEVEEEVERTPPPKPVVRTERANGNEPPPHDDADEPFSSYGDPPRDEAFMEPIGRVVDRIRRELDESSNDLG